MEDSPDFGILDSLGDNNDKKIDTSDPKNIKEVNESKKSYSDWEMRIYSLDDKAMLLEDRIAVKVVKTIISSLLVCLGNARGYEDEYRKFRDRYINLPKLGNLKTQLQGNDYDIVELQTNESIYVPLEHLKLGVQIMFEKQASRALQEAMVLETDIKRVLRRELGFFDERKTFNSNEYIKMQMMNSAMPTTPESSLDSINDILPPPIEEGGDDNNNVRPRR